MASLFCLLAKPVRNLDLCLFVRYYAELCEALSSCPKEVAGILYSNELLTRLEKSQAGDFVGLAPFEKAEVLIQAVERKNSR